MWWWQGLEDEPLFRGADRREQLKVFRIRIKAEDEAKIHIRKGVFLLAARRFTGLRNEVLSFEGRLALFSKTAVTT